MVPSNKSTGAYDIHLYVLRASVRPIVKLGVYFENVEFMNKTINMCKVVNSKNEEPLLRLITKILIDNEKARMPKKCPVEKVHLHHHQYQRIFKFIFFLMLGPILQLS